MIHRFLPSAETKPSRRRATVLTMVLSAVDVLGLLIIGLALIPLYFAELGATRYGYWLASAGMVLWLGSVDLSRVASQRTAHVYGKRDFGRAAAYFWKGLFLAGGVAILAFATGWFLAPSVPQLFGASEELQGEIVVAFRLALAGVALSLVASVPIGFLLATQSPQILVFLNPIAVTVQIVAIVHGLMHDWGIPAIPFGLVLRHVVLLLPTAALSVTVSIRWSARYASSPRGILPDLLQTGPAVLIQNVTHSLLGQLPPTIITLATSPEITAAYDATVRTAQFLIVLLQRIPGAAGRSFSHLLGDPEERHRGAEIARIILRVSLILTLVGAGGYWLLNEAFVGWWIGPEFFLSPATVLAMAAAMIPLQFYIVRNFLVISAGAIWRATLQSVVHGVVTLLALAGIVIYGSVEYVPLAFVLGPIASFLTPGTGVAATIGVPVLLRRDVVVVTILATAGFGVIQWIHQTIGITSVHEALVAAIVYGVVASPSLYLIWQMWRVKPKTPVLAPSATGSTTAPDPP